MPISLDVGTDNVELLADPFYRGYRQRRLRGREYEEFIEAFVEGVRRVFPHALLQWEDFHKNTALQLLDRYRKRLPSFNDDIQGTASVSLGGILSALRITGGKLVGPAAGLPGRRGGRGGDRPAGQVWHGEGRGRSDHDSPGPGHARFPGPGLQPRRRPRPVQDASSPGAATELDHYEFQGDGPFPLLEVVARVKPTVLVGTTGNPGVFTEAVIREMARHVDRPVILPLSNPTSRTECSPYEALRWTEGRAIVATGSPFAPLEFEGKVRHIGQANNVYIFPGIGLGAILSETHEVSDSMFLVAAEALATCVTDDDLAEGRIYPDQSHLRRVARTIAAAVIREARQLNLGRMIPDEAIDSALDEFIWYPDYRELLADEP